MRLLALTLFCATLAAAQTATPQPLGSTITNAPQTAAEVQKLPNKDLDPIGLDRYLNDLYQTISGPIGQRRDPDKFRNLFVRDARLIAVGQNKQTGAIVMRSMSVDDYITNSFPYLEKNGFYERESARRMERFGNIIHVWSTYESRHKPDEQPFQKGINSIQLFNDGSGWKAVTILWEDERPDNPIPQQYLESH